MSKMGSHRPFGHFKHKLWPKEGPRVKLAIWLWPLKVRNRPNFVAHRWHVACHWKALDERYNFAWNLISIQGLHAKLWGPKVAGVPTLAISGLPLGSPETKSHLDVGTMERCRVYYKGKVVASPQVRAMVSLVSLNCPWLVLAPKVLQLCTNHFVLVLCRPVWVNEACQFFLVPSRSSNTPLYPSKVLRAKQRASTPFFRCFLFGTYIWVLQGVGSVSARILRPII
jgi:hypothetical protein